MFFPKANTIPPSQKLILVAVLNDVTARDALYELNPSGRDIFCIPFKILFEVSYIVETTPKSELLSFQNVTKALLLIALTSTSTGIERIISNLTSSSTIFGPDIVFPS